jgi:hypothetical protein
MSAVPSLKKTSTQNAPGKSTRQRRRRRRNRHRNPYSLLMKTQYIRPTFEMKQLSDLRNKIINNTRIYNTTQRAWFSSSTNPVTARPNTRDDDEELEEEDGGPTTSSSVPTPPASRSGGEASAAAAAVMAIALICASAENAAEVPTNEPTSLETVAAECVNTDRILRAQHCVLQNKLAGKSAWICPVCKSSYKANLSFFPDPESAVDLLCGHDELSIYYDTNATSSVATASTSYNMLHSKRRVNWHSVPETIDSEDLAFTNNRVGGGELLVCPHFLCDACFQSKVCEALVMGQQSVVCPADLLCGQPIRIPNENDPDVIAAWMVGAEKFGEKMARIAAAGDASPPQPPHDTVDVCVVCSDEFNSAATSTSFPFPCSHHSSVCATCAAEIMQSSSAGAKCPVCRISA